MTVKRRPQRAPSFKQLEQQWSRFIPNLEIDSEAIAVSSLSDRKTALATLARIKEAAAQAEAAIDAAPDPKPRRRRRKEKPKEEPRCRPGMSEAELNARWEGLSDARRERATLKTKAAAAAADARDRDGVPLKAACDAAAQGKEWRGSTVYSWFLGRNGKAGLEEYPRHLWALVMAPKHLGGTAEAECHPAAWEAFKADFLRLEAPSLEMCFRNLQRLAKSEGWEIPLSAAPLGRRLEREVHPAAVTLAREGPEAVAKRRPAQIRERPLWAMEVVNADGHIMDVFVLWPDGKVERPTLVAWQDIHSGKILSWRIDRTENADGYRLSFADLLRDYGIPQHVFVDNGRAIAAKGLTGGTKNRYRFKVKRDDPVGLLTQLVGQENIHWTTPYHGQSKPIERAFRDMASDIAKDVRLRGAYTGNKPDAKPENYGSKAAPLDKFLEVVAEGIRRHNARRGRRGMGMEGRSFDEVFAVSYEARAADIPRPTEAQLARWLLGAKGTKAHAETGAVELFGTRYWSERLSEKLAGRSAEKRRVVVRFDPDHLGRPVIVEELGGKLIGKAEAQGAVQFMDTQAARETARDKARLKRNARAQLDIHRGMGAREYGSLLDAADAEEKGAEAAPARSNLVAGAFGREPARAKPALRSAEAIGTDNLIRMMVDRTIPPIDDEEAI